MSKIWTGMMFISLVVLIFVEPNLIINTMINQSKDVVSLCINLLAIYAVWLGILEIVDKSGLGDKLAKFLSPVIKRLFKINDAEQIKYVSYNLSCNLLGLGNAATPSGIKAIKSMEKDLKHTKFAMLMLLVINSTGIQFLPTTVIGLRASAQSTAAADIILPTLISSLIATTIAVGLLFIYKKIKKL